MFAEAQRNGWPPLSFRLSMIRLMIGHDWAVIIITLPITALHGRGVRGPLGARMLYIVKEMINLKTVARCDVSYSENVSAHENLLPYRRSSLRTRCGYKYAKLCALNQPANDDPKFRIEISNSFLFYLHLDLSSTSGQNILIPGLPYWRSDASLDTMY